MFYLLGDRFLVFEEPVKVQWEKNYVWVMSVYIDTEKFGWAHHIDIMIYLKKLLPRENEMTSVEIRK